MKHPDLSILVSKSAIIVFAAMLLGLCIFAPSIIQWLIVKPTTFYSKSQDVIYYFLFWYISAILAYALLFTLYRLLTRIEKKKCFVIENIYALHHMSYICFCETVVMLASSVIYLPCLIVAVAAGFMGLILRVIKNVFEEALLMKEENELTI